MYKVITTLLFFASFLTVEAQKNDLKLVWSDEFNYTGLPDSTKWIYEEGYVRNKEIQYYTLERIENARVENGILVLEARNDSAKLNGAVRPVTSSSLITKGLYEWKYGRIEVRAKIPSVLGSWPAIWMLGNNIDSVGWPECGEIDILEHVGYDPNFIHTNIHTKAYNHSIKTNRGKATPFNNPHTDFHMYAIEWTPEKIDFFIDQTNVFSFSNENNTTAEWPFKQPYYLILNLAVGGSWGGQKGIDLAALPYSFLIDYVRVYQ